MKISFLAFWLTISITAIAQRQTFDLVTYVAPKGWKKELKDVVVSYSYIDKKDKSWCQMGIFKSTQTKGSLKADFESEWTTLVENQYKNVTRFVSNDTTEDDGWKIKSEAGKYVFNSKETAVLLTIFSGYGVCISMLATTPNQRYLNYFVDLIESIEINKPATQGTNVTTPAKNQNSIPANKGFAFTTTNFDDGWTTTEQDDWVRAVKGNATVLIHYAQPDIRSFNNLDEKTAFVWNTLVAPRYKNISNLWIRKSWWADGGFMDAKYYAEAELTDNSSGKRVFVVLFRNGNGGKWIEIITSSKANFQSQFGIVYQQDGTNWNKLSSLANLNKFAVAASDLLGTWKASSGAGVEYYNIYTGNSMGMATASSSTEFIFKPGNEYTSIYKGVDGVGLTNRYHGETYNGKCIVSNWEIKLTNRFKGATESYTAQFEAVEGGRILHMYRSSIEELHLFKVK